MNRSRGEDAAPIPIKSMTMPAAAPAIVRRNVKTIRHHNARTFLDVADDIDQVLSQYRLQRVINPGSVSWKLPSHHAMAGVAAAELTCESGNRRSFGINEELVFQNAQVSASGLFRSAFRVIPVRPGTASFLDFRLIQDTAQRHAALAKACELMDLMRDEGDDDQFGAALQSL
jgi:hypothetical protein